MELSDVELIEFFIEDTASLPQTVAAARAGVGQHTVSRWRRGERRPLRSRTRTALRSYFLERTGAVGEIEDALALTAAELLIRVMDHPETGWGGVTERVKAAYVIALDLSLDAGEMQKLDAWRDSLLVPAPEISAAQS